MFSDLQSTGRDDIFKECPRGNLSSEVKWLSKTQSQCNAGMGGGGWRWGGRGFHPILLLSCCHWPGTRTGGPTSLSVGTSEIHASVLGAPEGNGRCTESGTESLFHEQEGSAVREIRVATRSERVRVWAQSISFQTLPSSPLCNFPAARTHMPWQDKPKDYVHRIRILY